MIRRYLYVGHHRADRPRPPWSPYPQRDPWWPHPYLPQHHNG